MGALTELQEERMDKVQQQVDGYFDLYDEGKIRGVDVFCQVKRLMVLEMDEKRKWLNEIISEAQMELTIMDLVIEQEASEDQMELTKECSAGIELSRKLKEEL